MTSVRRWLAVLLGTAVLVSLPSVVAALPASSSPVPAATLLARINQSEFVAFSGYAESTGGLGLPDIDQFSEISNLFGGQNQLRVWQRSPSDRRIDSIGFAGETDTHVAADGTWTWVYENNTATFAGLSAVKPTVRLPTSADLLPPDLTRRLLSQATVGEASRIGAARIAGHSRPGVRITPSEPASTIAHIDVWADADTGLPVRVEVLAKGASRPVLTSSFLDLSIGTPAPSTTAFRPPASVTLHYGAPFDVASALDQLGGGGPPQSLAGVARNTGLATTGSVGVYGRGVTEFVAVPIPRRFGFSLHDQLLKGAPGQTGDTVSLSSGPVNLLLTSVNDPAGPWLLIGTVTQATLAQAGAQLPPHPEIRR